MNTINKLMKPLIRFILKALLIGGMTAITSMPAFATEDETELPVYEGLGGDFTLTGPQGVRVGLQDFRGHVVLLFFGYTYCPDICPTTMVDLRDVINALGGQSAHVQTIFVSVDPERDSPERLRDFVAYFHPSFKGLTGSRQEIDRVVRQYGAVYFRQEVESAAGYLFAHTSYVFLIDKEGLLRGFYKTETDTQGLVEGIKLLIAEET